MESKNCKINYNVVNIKWVNDLIKRHGLMYDDRVNEIVVAPTKKLRIQNSQNITIFINKLGHNRVVTFDADTKKYDYTDLTSDVVKLWNKAMKLEINKLENIDKLINKI